MTETATPYVFYEVEVVARYADGTKDVRWFAQEAAEGRVAEAAGQVAKWLQRSMAEMLLEHVRGYEP